jgi:hyperosmotically inducible periplasmic protein
MRMNLSSLGRWWGILAVVLMVGAAGCQSGSDRSTGQAINDRMTSRDVKKALARAPVFKFPDVNVAVYEGNVQLTGFVATQEQREQAAQIAAGVKGVNQVVNQIMIKSMPTGRATIRDPLGRDTGKLLIDTNAQAVPNVHTTPLPPTERPQDLKQDQDQNQKTNPNP